MSNEEPTDEEVQHAYCRLYGFSTLSLASDRHTLEFDALLRNYPLHYAGGDSVACFRITAVKLIEEHQLSPFELAVMCRILAEVSL